MVYQRERGGNEQTVRELPDLKLALIEKSRMECTMASPEGNLTVPKRSCSKLKNPPLPPPDASRKG